MREFKLSSPRSKGFSPLEIDTSQPVDLEIGAGVGMHAIQRAKLFPGRKLFAVERTKLRFTKFENQLANQPDPDLDSIYPVHATIEDWLPVALPDKIIENCFILYPNPYPKKKHENQRFINMPFFRVLLNKLKPTGRIIFASNVESYINEVKSKAATWGLKVTDEIIIAKTFNPRSHFEKKYLERGEKCRQIVLRKLDMSS